MAAARTAIRIIRPSRPVRGTDMVSVLLHAPGRDWLAIVSRPTLEAFGRAFTGAPVLEASILAAPITGTPGIHAFFGATRSMYDRIEFTSEHRTDSRTWLEWQGDYRGLPIAGVTSLITGPTGAIGRVRLFHMPLTQLIAFAADLRQRLTPSDQGDFPC